MHHVIDLIDEQATSRLGHALAAALPPDAVIALHGTLGAGKTRLVQALSEAIDIDRRSVVSPTFVLIQEYEGARTGSPQPIYHIDAYRLSGPDEFRQLGGEEYFTRPGWVLIEWAERIAACLPPDLLDITLEVTGDETRRCTIVGHGPELAAVSSHLGPI
jgi:tRNA threonylcarbamoyladenosine biosynthesis protein TsaE